MTATLSLDVELQPDWANVTRASEAAGLLAFGTHGSEDLRDAVAMVSAELLENALKYADPHEIVRLNIEEDRASITVSVTNALVQPSDVERLADKLAWLDRYPDAATAWADALMLATGPRVDELRGGLGLLRIAFEGGSKIEYDASTPGVLTVRAHISR
jgi:hypothetical protein